MFSLIACCRSLQSKSYVRKSLVCKRARQLLFRDNHAAQYTSVYNMWLHTTCGMNKTFQPKPRKPNTTHKERNENSSPHSSTVFSAGAAKKRSEMMKSKIDAPTNVDTNSTSVKRKYIVPPSVPLGSDEWRKLKDESFRPNGFVNVMMSKMIAENCDINVAKSLLNFAAKEQEGISYELLLKYLALCIKQNNITEVYDIYEIMRNRFKSFDTGAYSLFIKGFSQTDNWRESIKMLETLKRTIKPSSKNYGDCIKAAIVHREAKQAWALYKEMLLNDLIPCDNTLQSLFDADRDLQDDTFRTELINILGYFRDHQIYPGEYLMQSIKLWFESIPDEHWRGYLSRVSDSGHCEACKQQLESIHLKPEEYSALKDVFLTTVIKGHDVFRKTTPQELQEFQHFVRSNPPYDVVVDGLNVAHMDPKGIRSQTLLDVVTSLSSGGKRVLVLGRKHMLKESRTWVKRHIQLLQKKSDCFFIDDISEDDPFLLYASLSSGNHCCFLTRDLLRDHKACLPDAHTQRLFFKWQRGHQLVIPFYTLGSKVFLQPRLSYDTILQSTDVSWHIPYDKTGVERASFEVPKTWLCLQKRR
ncbi:mitochondrial ribonuclease P catalytic subunit [Bombina bombina]|uniref:mitochondrial ribonuclease P catalytic subunit n=1 Tax=Bombina bombina TaxID=8345 RepID=UPI00235A5548|nr:mitochondrial ribonuclease P catalytic subunit [Bombina bombina]